MCGNELLNKGQRRTVRFVSDVRKDIVTEIITLYNCGEQNSVSERTSNFEVDDLQQQKATHWSFSSELSN